MNNSTYLTLDLRGLGTGPLGEDAEGLGLLTEGFCSDCGRLQDSEFDGVSGFVTEKGAAGSCSITLQTFECCRIGFLFFF